MSEMTLPPMEGFKFGCDPEMFVFDENGKPVSAAGLFPGTKEAPHPVRRGAVQVDGMAAEFNIIPARTFQEFNRNIATVMKEMETYLPEGYSLRAVPAVRFDPENFARAPEEAKQLGCNPDYNAWTGEMNPMPSEPDDPFLRTGAGHLHIGWTEDIEQDEDHIRNCQDLVKQLDWYLAAWSVQTDPDLSRRKLYGQAGAYRPKPYGVEYRTLSNFWITTRDRRLAVWNRMQRALFQMRNIYMPDRVKPEINALLVEGINQSKLDPVLTTEYRFPIISHSPSFARV